tara:strand:- start:781 stop:966 length:186 start_codon:yes stop_codon:yes gene_type:complete
MELPSYIQERHNGNTSAFARTQGVQHSQAVRWLKRNCVVIDGVVYCEVSKQAKGVSNDSKD